MFHSKYYVGCAQHGDRPYLKADKPSRFWLPIISLLTGMRPKEICQMHVADLKVSDDGVLYFHVIADKDDKTVKTPTSRRKIPVHPELVRMGFVDYVESVRKQGHIAHDFGCSRHNPAKRSVGGGLLNLKLRNVQIGRASCRERV